MIRVTDGQSLDHSLAKSFGEAHQNRRDFGAIGISANGAIGWGKTSEVLLAAYHTGDRVGDTLDLPDDLQTGTV